MNAAEDRQEQTCCVRLLIWTQSHFAHADAGIDQQSGISEFGLESEWLGGPQMPICEPPRLHAPPPGYGIPVDDPPRGLRLEF